MTESPSASLLQPKRSLARSKLLQFQGRDNAYARERAALRFGCLFDSDSVGVVAADSAGIITDANDAFLEIVGYERQDLPIRWDVISQPHDRDADRSEIQQALSVRTAILSERELVRKDGSRVLVLVAGATLEEADGEFFCIVLDGMQERHGAALRRSVEKHRALIRAVPDAMFRFDRNGIYLDFLPADGLEPLGSPEFFGQSLRDILTPGGASIAMQHITRALETGTVQRFEYSLRLYGVLRHYEARLVPDEPESVLAVVRDVTEHRRAVEELEKSEQRYRTLYENIPLMYFTLNARGIVLSVNAEGAKQLGYRRDELVNQSVYGVFHDDDRDAVRRQIADVLRTPGKVAQWEFRKVHRDGRIMWVRESASAVRDADGQAVVLVVCENCTAQKETEAQLMRQQEQLRMLSSELVIAEDRERQKIARELHDDVGQLLTLARGKLGAVRAADPGDDATLTELRQLLDQALRHTRLVTSELSSPVLHELGLAAALESLGDEMSERGGFRFHFKATGSTEALMTEVSAVLYRSARELMMNVVKHANAHDVHASLTQAAGELVLTIADDGAGFDPRGTMDGFGSAGTFGLFSVREQVEHEGGRCEITSHPGRGTQTVITVPFTGDEARVARR